MHIHVETGPSSLLWRLSGVLDEGRGQELIRRARGCLFPQVFELEALDLSVGGVAALGAVVDVICAARRSGAAVVVRGSPPLTALLRLAQFDLLCSIEDLK